MKNKLTRKLMLSAFTLLFAVISLGASTYAWFVISNDTKVNTFEGTVTAGESGLEIAVGAVGGSAQNLVWRSTELDLATDFAAATHVVFEALQNQKDFSVGAFTKLNGTSGVANSTVDEDDNIVSGNYVAFRLYFRLADANAGSTGTVYLTDYDLTGPAAPSPWYVNKAYTAADGSSVGANTEMTYNVEDAARIAFVTQTATNIYEVEDAPVTATQNRSSGIGKLGAYDYYEKVIGTLAGYPQKKVTEDNPETENDETVYEDDYYVLSKLAQSPLSIGELSGTSTTYVDVYVWIEGWDMECINAIFSQTLKVLLKFSLSPQLQEDKGE